MTRTSLIEEGWWVEADDEEEAISKAFDGDVDNSEADYRRWVDYADDEWTVDDRVCIDPLYKMVKEFEIQKT